MKNKRTALFILTAAAIVLCVLYAAAQPSLHRTKTAKTVITNLLNAPNPELASAYDKMFREAEEDLKAAAPGHSDPGSSGILTLDSEEVRDITRKLLADSATDIFLEDCLRINEIMSLQQDAMVDGFESKLQELSVKKTSQKDTLSYDAVLLLSAEGRNPETVSVSGQVQFDPDGRISAMTLRSRELTSFLGALR